MQIKQFMSLPVLACQLTDTLSQAAQIMWEHDCGVVAVVDGAGVAVAMVTDRDICMAAYTQGQPLSVIPVTAAMSKRLIACHPDDSIEQAEALMCTHQIRRLAVVNGEGQPVGILSLNDLARAAVMPPGRASGGPNGVRLTATARTLAAVGAPRLADQEPRLA